MMRLMVCSLEDQASVNIKASLQKLVDWTEEGEFAGHPVLRYGNMVLTTIPGIHLQADNIDRQVAETLHLTVDEVIFLSRHRAASGQPSLTVHPIGNYGSADLGGKPSTLVPAAPELMTAFLRRLAEVAAGLNYAVTFEVTHHGPFLTTPTLFIEIGSDERTWGDRKAADAIASSLLTVAPSSGPLAIGIGGGHYAPRFTEVAMAKQIAFGHMLPNYALDHTNEAEMTARIRMALEQSGARMAYIHKRSMKHSQATALCHLVESLGARVIESSDLDDR